MDDLSAQWPWSSAAATRRGLADRIATRYPREQRSRRTAETAYRRLLARFASGLEVPWALAGGVALTLRLDPSRTSADLDLVVPHVGSGAAGIADDLRRAARIDLGDFMAFEITEPRADGPQGAGTRSVELRATASIGRTLWAAFPIDVMLATGAVASEPLGETTPLTGIPAVDDLAGLPVLPLPLQLAQKICAMFEVHGAQPTFSTRARDLADIAIAGRQVLDLQAHELAGALAGEVAERRARGTLPGPLPGSFDLPEALAADWARRWPGATRHADITFEEASAEASALLDPLLGGTASGRWRPEQRRWA